jgi:hypothetical protein
MCLASSRLWVQSPAPQKIPNKTKQNSLQIGRPQNFKKEKKKNPISMNGKREAPSSNPNTIK